jgi:hypothetical protein
VTTVAVALAEHGSALPVSHQAQENSDPRAAVFDCITVAREVKILFDAPDAGGRWPSTSALAEHG